MNIATTNPALKADQLDEILIDQKKAFLAEPFPSVEKRINQLNKLNNTLIDYRDRIAEAIRQDFGARPQAETELAEIGPLLEGIAYYRSRLKRLMRPQKRHTPILLMPAKVELHYQPLGVVGIVVPWNFPVFLALSPLIGALAAGNRAIIKASEFAPKTATLLQQMISEIYAENEVCVVTGGVDVATAFTKLPFDHLVYTGSTNVGRIVMRAAAENLTPVTLELGGKSPAIINENFSIDEAAKRIAFGKTINAGQICVAPDYVLCPKEQIDAFCESFIDAMQTSYPSVLNNDDFTAIITEQQKARLQSYLDDAEQKGAKLITINPSNESFEGSKKLPMTIVLGATDDMLVMSEEIFGPILPVLPFDKLDDAFDFVNSRPRPLALYYFDWDKKRADTLLKATHSGGVCINDTLSHVMADDVPFGGVGPSGMGHYHGEEGFLTFSKAKAVVRKGRINATALVGPPWGNRMFSMMKVMQNLRFRKRKIRDL